MESLPFEASLGCLATPVLDRLSCQLAEIDGLVPDEQRIILRATRSALLAVLHTKLCRVLLLELNAARVAGRLTAANKNARWSEFIALSSKLEFWNDLAESHYPGLLQRVRKIIQNRADCSLQFGRRWAIDRDRLHELLDRQAGHLLDVEFGAGDSHRGGQTVAMVDCEGGKIVYKPRSVTIDVELGRFIYTLFSASSNELHIRVPLVVDRGDYGWAEFVPHHYAATTDELRSFYRGIGQWLAIMRLLGGSDLHAENLIACGAQPVIVDCETLFTPTISSKASELGAATDRAVDLLASSALKVGLLPGRGLALGWRGVDSSALGALPGQQPKREQPDIVDAGTDEAQMGLVMVESAPAQNHPSADPALADHWPEVLKGFTLLTLHMLQLDVKGELAPMLERFASCRVRVVVRSTEPYVEVTRMLWHPVSLHDPREAYRRAYALLKGMADNSPLAPDAHEVIDAEISDLLDGDVPFFSGIVSEGVMEGPRGTHWLSAANLLDEALNAWRNADIHLEKQIIQGSMVSAYINDGWLPKDLSLSPAKILASDLDGRRRTQAKLIMESLLSASIRGEDQTVAWVAPVLGSTGWSVQPLGSDVYNGISGVALLVAAYLREVQGGRADPVPGLNELLPMLLTGLRLAHDQYGRELLHSSQTRPPPIGAYIGLGSQLWTWLVLAKWGIADDGLQRSVLLAEWIERAAPLSERHDLLSGTAGAVMSLLLLAQLSEQSGYLDLAVKLGDQLCAAALREDDRACWPDSAWPKGMGGFAHGATGIAWVLAKLSQASQHDRFADMSEAGVAFEESLFDEALQGWTDLRVTETRESQAAWCHGSVGIGLALADLNPSLADDHQRSRLHAAAKQTWRIGFGSNHTLCHGDLGAWELMQVAIRAGLGPSGLDRDTVFAHVLTSLEEHGPVCGWARDAFSPSLMPGVGGVAYQLLRAHPASRLPSVLTLGGGRLE